MAYSLPLDGESLILDWMSFLRTGLPAVDFSPARGSDTALPGTCFQRNLIVVSVQMVKC